MKCPCFLLQDLCNNNVTCGAFIMKTIEEELHCELFIEMIPAQSHLPVMVHEDLINWGDLYRKVPCSE